MRRRMPTAKTTLHPADDPREKELAFWTAIRRPHRIPTADGRIPMSDGAGVVQAAGEGVTEL